MERAPGRNDVPRPRAEGQSSSKIVAKKARQRGEPNGLMSKRGLGSSPCPRSQQSLEKKESDIYFVDRRANDLFDYYPWRHSLNGNNGSYYTPL